MIGKNNTTKTFNMDSMDLQKGILLQVEGSETKGSIVRKARARKWKQRTSVRNSSSRAKSFAPPKRSTGPVETKTRKRSSNCGWNIIARREGSFIPPKISAVFITVYFDAPRALEKGTLTTTIRREESSWIRMEFTYLLRASWRHLFPFRRSTRKKTLECKAIAA